MNKEIYQEGFLIKSPPTKRIWRGARWRRRWFTLKQGEIPGQFCLEYYTDRNCRKLKGVIDLDQCEQVDSGLRLEHRKQKFQFMFDIKTPRRTYYLAADTETDMRDWVNCICQVCNLHDFTKQPGERQYYNLSENDAPLQFLPQYHQPQSLTDVSHNTTSSSLNNFIPQPEQYQKAQQQQQQVTQSVTPDVIRRTEELSIRNTYQNNDFPYVNTEYSNRETMICDTKFQEQAQQLQQQRGKLFERNHPIQESPKSAAASFQNKMNSTFERSQSFRTNSSSFSEPSSITPTHTRAQSLSEHTPTHKAISSPNSSTGATKKIPENLVLTDTFVESSVEPSPALSTCSGPYIPISECFSGSPKCLNNENPTTPLNNLDPKFYDTPRRHNNIGLNLTSDQSYSPKIYNCPQQVRPRSGRSSPTDSESVFTDDEEWSHALPLRETIDRNTRPSDSSVENEAIVFTYTQRFSKIPEDGTGSKDKTGPDDKILQEKDKFAKRKHRLILESTSEDEKNREIPQFSDTDNCSPAIGPKDATCCVEESYDIPRSHHLPYYNMSQFNNNSVSPTLVNSKDVVGISTPNLHADSVPTPDTAVNSKTLPRPHFYTNAAPTRIEGNVFRYDFIEQPDAPAVNRSLKPKLSLEEKVPLTEVQPAPVRMSTPITQGRTEKATVYHPPSVDRKLKPAAFKPQESPTCTSSLRRKTGPVSLVLHTDTDYTINPKEYESRTLPRNVTHSTIPGMATTNGSMNSISGKNNNFISQAKSHSQLQYFDLDVANPPPQINRAIYANSGANSSSRLSSSIDTATRPPMRSSVVYNSVDFIKTEAFKRIREDAEKNRMKD